VQQPPPPAQQYPAQPGYPGEQPYPGQQPFPGHPGQQPPGQQPPGWGYDDDDDDWGSPPGKRKRGAGPIVAFVVVGALVIAGVGGLGWYFMRQSNSSLADPLTSTSATNSATPRETPTNDKSTSPSPTQSTTDTPLPTGKSREQILKQNKLYTAGALASVSCQESGTMPSSRAGVETYYKSIIACLNRSWPAVVEKAGYEFRAPKLVLWSGSVDTPCGDYVRAFYCPTNETIYMKWDDDVNQYNKYPEEYQKVYARMFASFQTAHEYGHHVQNLVGIFDAYATDRQNAGNNDAELELSRRLELQASCFGSVFWGANQPSYPITGEARRQWMFLVDHYGDEYGGGIRDHGGRVNHGIWSKAGFRTESPSSCNTWSAAPSKVS
jgi:predicted metalloprotease